MINKLYLTDNIYIYNNKFYYIKNNKPSIIKKHNWHTLLNEYGWEKLNKNWIIKLNKLNYSTIKKRNSLFGSLDCGGNGDCLFNCISYGLSNYFDSYDSNKLRNNLSLTNKDKQIHNILETYKISKENGDFLDNWDPNTITIKEFRSLLK